VTEEISSAVFSTGPGRRIAGYEIETELGRGGMAIVYRARDVNLGRVVALKILAPQLARDDSFRQRFIQESRAAAAVDHPHIIPVFEAGKADGELFIAMRYVSTGDVRTLLDTDGQLPVQRAVAIVAQVASALDAAHGHGLVHRDVKPANMLLAESADSGGNSDHVYLSDFGLSKQSLSPTGLTATGQFLGTLEYIAPEQIEGRAVDGRADLYALACATVEMLTGIPPFRRSENVALMYAQLSEAPPKLRDRRPELPPAVDQVVGKALAKAADARYPTCMEFANALRAACGPQAPAWTAAEPGLAPGRPATELARPPTGLAAGAGGAAGAAGGVGGAVGGAVGGGAAAAGAGAVAPEAGPAGPAAWPGSGSPLSVPPAGPLPGSWFREAPTSAAPGQASAPGQPSAPGQARPSPWSREAAPSSPSQWPPDPRASGPSSAQQNWPADPTSALAPASRVGAPYRPGAYPADQAGPPPQAGGRPPRRTGRTVLAVAAIIILGLVLGGVAYKLAHHSSAAPRTPPASSGTTPASSSSAPPTGPVAALTPTQVVEEYFQAINQHRYRAAWDLGGKNTHTTYANYVAGYNGTASDAVQIQSVSGNVVTAQVTATQTSGAVKVFNGTYTVQDGVITLFNVRQTSGPG
jgi:serine/threonine-protein kinase